MEAWIALLGILGTLAGVALGAILGSRQERSNRLAVAQREVFTAFIRQSNAVWKAGSARKGWNVQRAELEVVRLWELLAEIELVTDSEHVIFLAQELVIQTEKMLRALADEAEGKLSEAERVDVEVPWNHATSAFESAARDLVLGRKSGSSRSRMPRDPSVG